MPVRLLALVGLVFVLAVFGSGVGAAAMRTLSPRHEVPLDSIHPAAALRGPDVQGRHVARQRRPVGLDPRALARGIHPPPLGGVAPGPEPVAPAQSAPVEEPRLEPQPAPPGTHQLPPLTNVTPIEPEAAPESPAAEGLPPAEEPPAAEPPAEGPGPVQPPAEEPPANQPPAEEPPAEEPPAERPPAEEPPAEEPPAERPPAEEPPANQPPAEEPPAERPPAEEPPAEGPPAEEPPSVPPPVREAGFENGLVGWNLSGVGEVVPTVVTDIVREGTHSARVVLTGSENRSELVFGGNGTGSTSGAVEFEEGDEAWYGFSFYINQMIWGHPGAHNLIFQFKSDGEGSPALALDLWDYNPNGTGGRGLWSEGSATGGPNRFLAPLSEGTWYDVAIHIGASSREQGFYEVFLDGRLVGARQSASTIIPGQRLAYIKDGIYRNGREIPGTSEIRLDSARLGNSLASVSP